MPQSTSNRAFRFRPDCLFLILSLLLSVVAAQAAPESRQFFIDQTSIGQHQSYVVPEALPLVQSGQWVLEVEAEDESFDIEEAVLNKEYTPEDVSKLLATQSPYTRRVDTFRAQTFHGYAVSYSMAGRVARVFPSRMENEKFKEQDFRETLTLSYSPEIPSQKWLTYRFLSDEDDVVFYYSPVLKAVRRIAAANRSDTIFGSELNLNDLYGASYKTDMLTFGETRLGLYVAPFQEGGGRATVVQSCDPLPEEPRQGDGADSGGSAEGNKGYLLGAGWLPDGVRYKPAKLLRVEATVQDAYATIHQLVLYVDSQTGLIPYKIALGRTGEPLKFVMTVYRTIDGVPHVDSVAVKNLQSDKATLLTFDGHSVCADAAADGLLEDFTPKALAK